ncbi:MAG: GntR family transcriptional regulator [Deltaproteobacteria bacterium]|nr:GntR family transcriptional regulator [Deltaproteobacteria bacterium]
MLNLTSLREQVYHFLREEMASGRLLPGDSINPTEMSERLGISKTPLRDALIRLETEGFVTILPRRGITVNVLTLEDIKNFYGIIGALESAAIIIVFDRILPEHILSMKNLNTELLQAINQEDFDKYYYKNLEFHNVYLNLSGNQQLKAIMTPLKQRLYDFPRRLYIRDWEVSNCDEHNRFLALLEKGDKEGAARIMRDVHWSFRVQENYIRQFYSLAVEQIQAQQALRHNSHT